MEIFFTSELSVPLFQIIFLMLISTVALLFGKVRIALLINYVFTFYSNIENLVLPLSEL